MNVNQNNEIFSNDLPIESKSFSMIANTKNTNSQYLSAWTDNIGWELGKTGNCSRTVDVNNTVLSDFDYSSKKQKFIFFRADSGSYFIANQDNGRVFQIVKDPQDYVVIISADYDGSDTQMFDKIGNNNNFYLSVYFDNNKKYFINNCHNQPSPEKRQKITGITSNLDTNTYKTIKQTDIDLPELTNNPETPPFPPKLTSIDDTGVFNDKAPKVTYGSALIPAIVVKDHYPVQEYISNNPYYVLKRKKYWYNLATGFVASGNRDLYTLKKGIYPEAQESFKSTVNMSITSDEYLRFYSKSTPFEQQIYTGLNTSKSYDNVDLSLTEELKPYLNINPYDMRYVLYVLVDEYELTRMDGTLVEAPWRVYTDKELIREYPEKV
ncbi:hypothetical protein [Bacillus zhangzhouensis]